MKTNLRWIIEAALVFGSVLAAFFVEDYRQERQERKDYLNTLVNFRNDVHREIAIYRYLYDTSLVIERRGARPPYVELDSVFHLINSILNDKYLNNNSEGYKLLAHYLTNESIEYGSAVDFRNQSPHQDELKKFPRHLIEDSLDIALTTYHSFGTREFHYFQTYNGYRASLINHLIATADYRDLDSDRNRLAMESPIIKNHIQVFIQLMGVLRQWDRDCARGLSWILDKLDKKLHEHGIDTSALDRQYMLPKEEWNR